MTSPKKKIGLALGAGGAKGLVHIGILKALHRHGISPDYIAGTSMGAVIGAAYAAGHSPEELEEIAKTTDWKEIVDFTIPKAGLIKGAVVQQKIRTLVRDKSFGELSCPLRIVAYNLSRRKRVVFSRGSVAQALRASIAIPGIFAPLKLRQNLLVDGSVADPTPFDVVQEMGADIVIAVDLYPREGTESMPAPQRSLLQEWKKEFVVAELFNVRNYLFPERWPGVIRRLLRWLFDKFLYPAKVLRIMARKELPPITRVMYDTVGALTNNLARERMEHADVDVKITPSFGKLQWHDFDKVDAFVRIGEKAMEEKIAELKRLQRA